MSSLLPLVLCLCAYENAALLQSAYVIIIMMFIVRYYKKLDSRIPGVIRVADKKRLRHSLPSSTGDGENSELLVVSLVMESTIK